MGWTTIIDYAWLAVGVVWLVTAFGAKPIARQAPGGSTLLHLVAMSIAGFLLFSNQTRFGILAWNVWPQSRIAGLAGFILVVTGVCFAIWARLVLGRNWSGIVTVKQDHDLIRTGPYAIVRHPIYAGFLLAVLGTVIARGEVRSVLAFPIALFAWWRKLQLEEAMMSQEFGEHYEQYSRQVKKLIPFVA
jgi:protein-S-isoprenylcysteine O-methyltransferase Ste14